MSPILSGKTVSITSAARRLEQLSSSTILSWIRGGGSPAGNIRIGTQSVDHQGGFNDPAQAANTILLVNELTSLFGPVNSTAIFETLTPRLCKWFTYFGYT